MTNDEVIDHLKAYLSDTVINKKFHDDFVEYDGNLYMLRGARGYGAVSLDITSLKFTEIKDEKYYVSVDILLFDKYYHIAEPEFQRTKDTGLLTGIIDNSQ